MNHQTKIQTMTHSQQPPFYFGGSQVPFYLNTNKQIINGTGFMTKTKNPVEKYNSKLIIKPFNIKK